MRFKTHLFLYCIVSLLLILHTSCENKRDNSGTLGGMWQLVEWKNANGSIAYNKPDTTIYYKVRNNILMLQELPGETDTYFITYYHQTENQIIINQPYKIVRNSERDTIFHPIEVLRKYGVPANGCLHIDVLNSDIMQLSGEEGTLRFRKY